MSQINKKTKVILLITTVAISAAMYYVLDRVLKIEIGNFKITLNALPLIIVTLLYGTKVGLLTALIGTFLSQVFSEYGLTPTTPLWMLPEIIRVLIIGIGNYLYLRKLSNHYSKFIRVMFIPLLIILSSIIVTMLNTGVIAVDALIYKYYSKAYVFSDLIIRLMMGIVSGIIYAIVCPITVKHLKIK